MRAAGVRARSFRDGTSQNSPYIRSTASSSVVPLYNSIVAKGAAPRMRQVSASLGVGDVSSLRTEGFADDATRELDGVVRGVGTSVPLRLDARQGRRQGVALGANLVTLMTVR